MGESQNRIISLDGLRGFAALVVLLHHSLLVIPSMNDESRGLNVTPLHALWAGREAVYVFFILSGIVLTLPALNRQMQWQAYYPSRLVRLYLPVVAAVVLGWIVTSLIPRVHEVGQSAWMRTHYVDATPLTYIRDAFLLTGTSNVNTPLWSLQWEVVFSLLLPAYVWAAVRLRRFWLLAAVACTLVSAAGAGLHIAPVMYLPMFLVGAILAVRLQSVRDAEKLLTSGRGAVVLVIAIVGVTAAYWSAIVVHSGAGTATLPVVVASAAVLIVLAVAWPPFRALLSTPFFQLAGRISFSLYLTHELIVVSVGQLLPSTLVWLTPVCAIPIALVLAVLFFRFVEAPAHRLSKRVARAAQRKKDAASQPVKG